MLATAGLSEAAGRRSLDATGGLASAARPQSIRAVAAQRQSLGGCELVLTHPETDMPDLDRGYAVGWGTLALINAGLAQAKGHSRLTWFLLSLLLGPIATFVVVVVLNTHAPKRSDTA